MKKEEILTKVIKDLAKLPFTKVIYIFGSYIEGKSTKISDIDICVIDDVKYPKKTRRKIYIYSEHPFDVSLFSDLPLNIRYEVFKGKCVKVKDKDFLVDIKVKTLAEYFDMKPIWEKGLKIRKAAGYRVV